MATAKKLKSGSWRCLAYSHTDNVDGKKVRRYKSFTAASKKEAEYMASEYLMNKEDPKNTATKTYGEALDDYIKRRESILSPATVREYKRSRRVDLQDLIDTKLCDLTQDQIQEAINQEASTHSAKSVRNMHGLLSAVLKAYRPNFALHTDLPKKTRPQLYVPSDTEIKQLFAALSTQGELEMEIACLLAAFGPMRRGEIAALHSDQVTGNIVHVKQSMVMDENKNWVIKAPKSYAGDRFIEYPDFVIDKIKDRTGRILTINPSSITNRFLKILKNNNIPHFRFHDLRHYSASIQHALGIPDQYIMLRGGWNSDAVLKSVYRHAMDDKVSEMNKVANDHFKGLMQHEMQHKKK